MGVDIFFIISGYLITKILFKENQQGEFSFIHFYARRIKRIFPALFVVIAIFTLLAILSFAPKTYNNYILSARYAAAQFSNLFFARKTGYFDEGFQNQPLLHTWSLGVEEQFYLFWPLLIYGVILFLRRKEKKMTDINMGGVLLFIALASYLSCRMTTISHPQLSFYMFYSRAWEFCIGGLLSLDILPRTKRKSVNQAIGILAISLLLFSFFFIGKDFLGQSFLQFGIFFPCLGTALLIYLRPETSLTNKIIARKPPVFIGKISYSLYLYHWPTIIFYQVICGVYEFNILSSILIISISFSLATLSYFFIEQPARKAKISNSKALITGGCIALCFIMLFKFLEPYDTASWRVEKYNNKKIDFPHYHYVTKKKNNEVFIEYNSQKDTPLISLVGDSHAEHFLDATAVWGKKNGYGTRYFGRPGCPMLLSKIKIKSFLDEKYTQSCMNAPYFFEKEIINNPQVKIVLIAQRFDLIHNGIGYLQYQRNINFIDPDGNIIADYTKYYESQLAATVQAIKEKGKKVILVQQVPISGNGKDLQWKPLLKKWFSLELPAIYDKKFLEKWQQPSRDFVTRFASREHVDIIDIFPYFTSPVINEASIYVDNDHLSFWGRSYIVPFFGKEMDKIMNKKPSTAPSQPTISHSLQRGK